MSLLGGIDGRPFVLVYHFFAVALYSVWVRMTENSVIKSPLVLLDGFRVIWTAAMVIGPFLLSEVKA